LGRTDQVHERSSKGNIDRADLAILRVESRLLVENETVLFAAPGDRNQVGAEVGRVGEERTNAEIVALEVFDGLEDVGADGFGSRLLSGPGWPLEAGLQDTLDLVQGTIGKIPLKELLDGRLRQVLPNEVLSRKPVGIEITLDGVGNRLLVRLRTMR
jgi:hypothetical protein